MQIVLNPVEYLELFGSFNSLKGTWKIQNEQQAVGEAQARKGQRAQMGSVRCQMEDECRSSDCRMESLSDGGHTDPSYSMWLVNGIFSQSKNYQLIAMKVSFLLMQQHHSIAIVVP